MNKINLLHKEHKNNSIILERAHKTKSIIRKHIFKD